MLPTFIPLIPVIDGTPVIGSNTYNPNVTKTNYDFQTIKTYTDKPNGGSGWEANEIADKAINGKHYSSNIKRANTPTTEIGFGSNLTTIFTLNTTIPYVGADVILNACTNVECTSQGDNLLAMAIQRSPDNIVWTTVILRYDTLYVSNGALNFRWLNLTIPSFIDIVPNAGIWYYRVQVQHQRNNIAVPNSIGTCTTATLTTPNVSYFTLEWRNQRQ